MVKIFKPVKKNFGRWWKYPPEMKDRKARGVIIAVGTDKWKHPILVFLDAGKLKANGWSAYDQGQDSKWTLKDKMETLIEYEPKSIDRRRAMMALFIHKEELLKMLGKMPR